MKFLLVEDEQTHRRRDIQEYIETERQTDGNDGADNRSLQFCKRA